LELRARIGELNELLGGDLFAFANLSAGAAKVEDDPSVDFLPLRLDATLGIGARLSATFGFLVAASAISDGNPDASFRPALTVEIGTFSAELEDRR